MADKQTFQHQVVDALLKSGFKDIFEQQEHKEFIEMIAATYFTDELNFEGIIEYLADIVEDADKRKAIAEIIKQIKTPKVEKKPQQVKEKQEKTQKIQKKPEKKVKTEHHPKPKEQKPEAKIENQEETKKEGEAQQEPPANGGQRKGLKQELQSSGKVKCRFFPFCKNPDTCGFFHPTDKCQYFPNCRYGDNCLYVHEACRFKEKCSKLNCPYAHPGKRPSNPLEAFMKNMMMSKNQNMFKNKNRKKPNQHEGKEDEAHDQQQ